jgi:hypothetical protein
MTVRIRVPAAAQARLPFCTEIALEASGGAVRLAACARTPREDRARPGAKPAGKVSAGRRA